MNDRKIQTVLRETFGLARLRPGQRDVIQRVLAGHHTLALMPTGAGKSLCYQLPAVLLPGATLVVSPLIALMQDQCAHLAELGIAAALWHSASSAAELEAADRAWADGVARIGFVTPERLGQPEAMAVLRGRRVSLLVVDEAHCITQWGHDFRPAYREIGNAWAALRRPTVLALTATAGPEAQQEIRQVLRITREHVVSADSYRPNLRLGVDLVDGAEHKLARVLAHLRRCEGPALVYTATIKAAEALQQSLVAEGVQAGLYHGRLPAAARQAAQRAFMQDETRTMVATNAFGLGIDKPDIRLVLHHQLPASLDVYYQEAGRAGRDGQPADCVLLYLRSDRAVQQFFLNGRYPDADDGVALLQALAAPPPDEAGWPLPALRERLGCPMAKLRVLGGLLARSGWIEGPAAGPWRLGAQPPEREAVHRLLARYEARGERDRERLEAMVGYAQSGQCRWQVLLAFSGDTLPVDRCGNCDNCRRMAEHEQIVVDAHAAAPAGDAAADALPALPAIGTQVRVNRYGLGRVVRTSWDSVTVSFASQERNFHPDFVRPVPGRRGRVAHAASAPRSG